MGSLTAIPCLRSAVVLHPEPVETMTNGKNSFSAFGEELLLLAPFIVWTICSYFLRPTDPDLWWHLKMGEVMLDSHSIPSSDIFSFISFGKPMLAHEWLSEVFFASVYRASGYVGLCGFFGVLAGITFLLVYRTCRYRGVGVLASALTSVVAFRLASVVATVRPQMFTVFGMAVLVHALTRLTRGSLSFWGWSLPIVFCVWANLHGGYILGVAMLWGTFVVGWFSLEKRTLRQLGCLSGACTMATLLTPHGVQAWIYPFQYANLGSASLRYITEWQSPSFHEPTAMVLLSLILVMSVVGIMKPPSTPIDVAWTLIVTTLALLSSRHVPLFGIVAAPIIGARLLFEFPSIRRWIDDFNIRWVGLALCLAMPVVFFFSSNPRIATEPITLQLEHTPSEAGLPRDAVRRMASAMQPGNVISEYDWGGYLIFMLYPEWKVGIDGRADVHGDYVMDLHYQLFNAHPGWQQVAAQFKPDYLLARRFGALSLALNGDPNWELVFEGPIEKLFVSRGSRSSSLVSSSHENPGAAPGL